MDGWPPNTIPNPLSPTLIEDFGELRAERETADLRAARDDAGGEDEESSGSHRGNGH